MRISKGKSDVKKRSVKAATSTADENRYEEAISYIKSAMNCLNPLAAENDEVARDAIVNMSVVAFDLKGTQSS